MSRVKSGHLAKLLLWIVLGIVGICLGAAGVSFIVNCGLSTRSQSIKQFSEADLARLAEALHMQRSLPSWKSLAMQEGFYLDEILADTLKDMAACP